MKSRRTLKRRIYYAIDSIWDVIKTIGIIILCILACIIGVPLVIIIMIPVILIYMICCIPALLSALILAISGAICSIIGALFNGLSKLKSSKKDT